jgi:hypothetical protein
MDRLRLGAADAELTQALVAFELFKNKDMTSYSDQAIEKLRATLRAFERDPPREPVCPN